ncbi:MAG: hypothetical protein ACRDFB_01425, partial [Rhabdochlamydiaceae bacterium]
MIDEKIDITEANARIDVEAKKWKSGNREGFWGEFAENPSQISPLLQKFLVKFEQEKSKPGLVVDLGCGNSRSAIFLLTSVLGSIHSL